MPPASAVTCGSASSRLHSWLITLPTSIFSHQSCLLCPKISCNQLSLPCFFLPFPQQQTHGFDNPHTFNNFLTNFKWRTENSYLTKAATECNKGNGLNIGHQCGKEIIRMKNAENILDSKPTFCAWIYVKDHNHILTALVLQLSVNLNLLSDKCA